ncbi:MAG: hypothetical protein JWO08_663 [Verrucomicrobiaceae bacterium]|nr:hypothetical protein [Verrucomicrobiaceae bacterium]
MICHRPHDPSQTTTVPLHMRRTVHGFSMTEMVWVVAMLGILATMVIANVGSVVQGSRETVAHQKLEMLNSALATYAQTGSEINFPASSSSSDEVVVLHYLQGRSTSNPQPGSPFVSPRYRPQSSSSTDDYRLVWTGAMYKLLVPGQNGTGLRVPFDGAGDIGEAWIQPPDWQPYGK